MTEDDRSCVEVLIQIPAARSAPAKVGKVLLASCIQACVVEAFWSEDVVYRRAKMEELLQIFEKSCNR